MKSNKIYTYLILLLCFMLFNIFVVFIPIDKSNAFYAAYFFSLLSFASQAVIWQFAFKSDDLLKNKFLGIPLIHIGIVYIIIQVFVALIFRILPNLPLWSSVVSCSTILAVFAVILLSVDFGKNNVKSFEENIQKKVYILKELQTDVEIIAEKEKDNDISEKLRVLASKLRYSDPMSNYRLTDLDEKIRNNIELLKSSETDKLELIKNTEELLFERNKKCKIMKE